MAQLFLSHTKLDEDFWDRFDRAAAREGIKVFRSERARAVPKGSPIKFHYFSTESRTKEKFNMPLDWKAIEAHLPSGKGFWEE